MIYDGGHFPPVKPWDLSSPWGAELRVNHFHTLRRAWYGMLSERERALADSWS